MIVFFSILIMISLYLNVEIDLNKTRNNAFLNNMKFVNINFFNVDFFIISIFFVIFLNV